MEVRVANDPTSLGDAPVTIVVQHDEWPDPAESLPPPYDNRLAQPYGGYISPGSTLDEFADFRQSVGHRRAGTSAVPGDPVRVNPFQALVGGYFLALRPQCVRSRSESLVDQARCGLASPVVGIRPQVAVGV